VRIFETVLQGAEAKVLEPSEMAEDITKEIHKLLALY